MLVWWPSPEIICTRVRVPHLLAAATIWGRCLFKSFRLCGGQRLFKDGVFEEIRYTVFAQCWYAVAERDLYIYREHGWNPSIFYYHSWLCDCHQGPEYRASLFALLLSETATILLSCPSHCACTQAHICCANNQVIITSNCGRSMLHWHKHQYEIVIR